MRYCVPTTVIALVTVATTAIAADIPSDGGPDYVPQQEIAPGYTWTGGYLGGFAGYSSGEFTQNRVGNLKGDGFQGGVYGGYNHQIDRIVLGAEADLGLSSVKDRVGSLSAEQTWVGSVRGRVGAAFDNVMVYGTGGLAATGIEVANARHSSSKTHYGWVAGAGVEGFVAPKVTARAEYLYSDFEKKTHVLPPSVSTELKSHTVRAGIGYNF